MADRWGRVIWPGVASPLSCTYTMGHGIAPGAAVLRCNPQPSIPIAPEGTLVLYDGVGKVALPDCKVESVRERRDGSGIVWEITILDRRWKWRDCGFISVWANQLDPHGKLIPWTVASPVELATRCLQQMGERRFKIDLPVGLTTAAAAGVKEFLPTGVNFPPTGVNPPVEWVAQRPMVVLEQLAEMFGRVVVYRWAEDAVWVVPKGTGAPLPPGSISSRCPGLDVPKTPDGVAVIGAPTRYQADLELQAVGEDWDGKIKPINDLSYAPRPGNGAKHKVMVRAAAADDGTNWRYYVTVNEVTFLKLWTTDAVTTMTDLVAQINASADTRIKGVVTARIDNAVPAVPKIFIEAVKPGVPFDASVKIHYTVDPLPDPLPVAPVWACRVMVAAKKAGADWSRCWPPLYHGVRATERLTLGQARDLARKSVWKYYQLSGRDVSKKGKTIIPAVGRVDKYRIVLLSEQCEQIVPELPDFAIRDRNRDPFVKNFYNGYSKCKPAEVYGSVNNRAAAHLLFVLDKAKRINTEPDERVEVSFTVDPTFHMIRFSSPVYKLGKGNTLLEPDIRLRTAVMVRAADTNSPLTFQTTRLFAGKKGRAITYERHDDVQLNVIPKYNAKGVVTGIGLLEADPLLRGRYYLDAMTIRYQYKPALMNVYNGIVAHQLDGACAQLTWNVSGQPGTGTETTASVNFEHNTTVPPYPARRRAEALRAAVAPGQFLGQIGARGDPVQPVPFQKPGA